MLPCSGVAVAYDTGHLRRITTANKRLLTAVRDATGDVGAWREQVELTAVLMTSATRRWLGAGSPIRRQMWPSDRPLCPRAARDEHSMNDSTMWGTTL
jgi:hypothetical protein